MDKKGNATFEQMGLIAVGLVVFAITLIIAFLVMNQGVDSAVDDVAALANTNHSVTTWVNATAERITNHALMELTCVALWNSSGHTTVIGTGNYSCDADSDSITITYPGGWNESTMYLSYTAKNASSAFNGTNNLRRATEDIPGWAPIIVITFIGGLLLGLVAIFRKKG